MKNKIVIDGKSYQASESGEALKDSEGNLIPFVEENEKPKPEENSYKKDLEEISAKYKEAQKKLDEINEAKRKAEEQENLKAGEYEKVLSEKEKELEDIKKNLEKVNSKYEKYKGTTISILENIEAKIPDDKKSLIPAGFSPRQKLEYIYANASFLGVTTDKIKAGDKIENNDPHLNLSEKEKLQNQFDELFQKSQKGELLTTEENNKMFELAKKIKSL